MRYLSVCSGIEAATVAWHPLGWEPAAFAEIEPFPRAVLAHHYPHVPLHGDFTTIKGHEYGAVDLLVGGTPCQSFSVAGLRKGLDDPRGNLMLEYGALAKRLGAKWLVWENVPGVLSSNGGRDFGSFLGMLAELGYGFAYRVLDAQYFGVAQRRRRVFVVGYLGDWRRAAAVLFERHSLSGHPAPRRETRQDVTGTLSSRTTGGGRLGTDFDLAGGLQPVDLISGGQLARCLTTKTRIDAETETLIPTLGGHFVDTVATLDASYGHLQGASGQDANHGHSHLVPIAFDCKASGQSGFGIGEIASTMRAMGHKDSHSNGGGHLAVCVTGDITHTLKAEGFDASEDGTGRGQPIVTVGADCFNGSLTGDVAATMGTRGSSETASGPTLLSGMAVRRLLPVECEALQGFPRNYTRIPNWNGWRALGVDETPEQCREEGLEVKQNAKTGKWRVKDVDGPRYKALGNSMAVPCMAWLGRRIQMVEDLMAEQELAA